MSVSSSVGIDQVWQFARTVVKIYGKNFERNDVIEYLNSLNETEFPMIRVPSNITEGSVNSKIRQHLQEGKTVSEISKILSISYQRAKNVQKMDTKKTSTVKEN
jgi:hypothetical protein